MRGWAEDQRWTTSELHFLCTHPDWSAKRMAAALDRTVYAINGKRAKLRAEAEWVIGDPGYRELCEEAAEVRRSNRRTSSS